MQIIQNLQEGNYTKHLKSKVVSFNPSVQVKTKRQKKKKKEQVRRGDFNTGIKTEAAGG